MNRSRRLLIAAVSAVVMLAAGAPAARQDGVRFVGKAKYLNHARAVVVHSIDDSTKLVVDIADAMDKYDIKGTFFISTEQDPPPEERFFNQLQVWLLWPRLQKAVENGHEIGAHAVTHPCSRPQSDTVSDTYRAFCDANYHDAELIGSRDTILKRTTQPYVRTWAYPCGHCANLEFIQKRIAAAGYIVARNYPGEAQGLHVRPDLQTWASNPFDACSSVVPLQGELYDGGDETHSDRIDPVCVVGGVVIGAGATYYDHEVAGWQAGVGRHHL